MIAALFHVSNPAWSAIAAWAGVAIALGAVVVAGLLANSQLGEARRLRQEQALPYVAVFADESAADWTAIDLVIKNFGKTAAKDVRVSIDPAPQRAVGGTEDVWMPTSIPVLVPGQEWRTFWDATQARLKSNLPDHCTVEVEFSDSRGKRLDPLTFDLDWQPLTQRGMVVAYRMHHAAKALGTSETCSPVGGNPTAAACACSHATVMP